MNFGYFNSPIGKIRIESVNEYITSVYFINESEVMNKNINLNTESECINDSIAICKEQLQEYFDGIRQNFDLKLKFLKGTEFQKNVWEELRKIPYGKTVSYKEMAERINNPKACRAIGNANNKNPIGIIIPCHRVIGANGKMIGYAEGVDKKEFLLNLEAKNSNK